MIKSTQKGFTLIEILVVIGIIAILAAIVLIAINPRRQFAQANNTQRRSNVNTILNAVGQYIADNKGALPPGVPADGAPPIDISDIGTGTGDTFCDTLADEYTPALPVDPSLNAGAMANGEISETECTAGPWDTGYEIKRVGDRITISAPAAELGVTIEVTR